jgi:hypothetical protein
MVAMFSACRAHADVSPQIAVDDVRSQSKQGAHDVQPETGLGSFRLFTAPAEKPVNHQERKTLSMSLRTRHSIASGDVETTPVGRLLPRTALFGRSAQLCS